MTKSKKESDHRVPKMKLCPYCNSGDIAIKKEERIHPYFLRCRYCGSRGPVEPNALDAIRAWNKRKK